MFQFTPILHNFACWHNYLRRYNKLNFRNDYERFSGFHLTHLKIRKSNFELQLSETRNVPWICVTIEKHKEM